MTLRKSQGFTLIELMIVVAIIGILAAIAIPAYNGYMNNSRMTKVTANTEAARKWVASGFYSDASRRALNITFGPNPGDFPRTIPNILAELNTASATAGEGGGAPFAAASDGNTGVVGVAMSHTNNTAWVRGDNITLTEPAYRDLAGRTITISY